LVRGECLKHGHLEPEAYIRARWPWYLRVALAKAADEMDQPAAIDTLAWEEVFEHTFDERAQP
jgi:hypothetical protein